MRKMQWKQTSILATAITVVFLPCMVNAGTLTVLHNFCDPNQFVCPSNLTGAEPHGLAADSSGNLYGVTRQEGSGATITGDIYELIKGQSGYTYSLLYNFCSLSQCADGKEPLGTPILDSSGNLYGVTISGGANNAGTIYKLSPPTAGGNTWTLTTLWSFCSSSACISPTYGLTYAGAASGQTYNGTSPLFGVGAGGANGDGAAYKFTNSGTSSQVTTLYSFCAQTGCTDGQAPNAVIADSSSNLYGTTAEGGSGGGGVAFEISPASGGGISETTLHTFCASGTSGCTDAWELNGPLTIDANGDLLGVGASGGAHGQGGAVFKIVPNGTSSTESLVYSFCASGSSCTDGEFPRGGVWLSTVGKIYGRTNAGGANNEGVIYSISPLNGLYSRLYSFCGGGSSCSDGDGSLDAGLIGDSSGNLYGTNLMGGQYYNNGGGTVFEWSP